LTDALAQCACMADTDGLYAIATASDNLKPFLLDQLKTGVIGVAACAWKEFGELYADKAEALDPYVSRRIIMKKAYHIGAASKADKLNSGFPRGAYDDNVELITASMASSNGYRILTSTDQLSVYEKMECDACEIETWVEECSATQSAPSQIPATATQATSPGK
jgi:hypothetical protein